MAHATHLTLQQLHDLRAALPDLEFNIHEVKSIPAPKLADEYLNFYGLNFDKQYFHRWGRVVVPGSEPGAHGWTIACHYWLPTLEPHLPVKGMVMVVHGYFDHVGLYGHLIKYLLEKGYGVVAFDLPGHGLSSGEPASIATFDHYSEVFDTLCSHVRNHFPVPLSAIGQSTGGAIILKHLATGHPELAKAAVLAPLVEPAFWWVNKIVYALTHRFRKGIRRVFMSNSSDRQFVEFLADKDPLQARQIPLDWVGAMKAWVHECHAMAASDYPVTVIQGDRDNTVAWRSNLKILARKFPRARIITVKGASHHLVNEGGVLRNQVFDALGF
jgi:alpha-beta hydrolase superfamily lysophospholipase